MVCLGFEYFVLEDGIVTCVVTLIEDSGADIITDEVDSCVTTEVSTHMGTVC